MRILHVVTLVSTDGSFGGPVSVAVNQTRELRARGHDVVIAAGSRGFGADPPAHLGGTPVHLFPAHQLVPGVSFSGLVAPAMFSWLRHAIRDADVVHVHLARDLVTLPAAAIARRAGVPYVLQPHGMVVESDSPLAGPLDALLTRRVLTDAAAVLYLTPEEQAGLATVVPEVSTVKLRNGVPTPPRVPPLPARVEVLFCARLQQRKRPLMFVDLAARLLALGVDADFVLVGPDGGEAADVEARIADLGDPRIRWEGALEPAQVLDRIGRASLLVLPSVDEPYPMSVLEAMSVGRGVVITDSCGLADEVRNSGAGVVVDETLDGLITGVRGLLTEPGALERVGERAAATAATSFAMEPVVDRLVELYTDTTTRRSRPR